MRALLILCCCCITLAARAAGLEYPDAGALATGRGGAVAAAPTGGLALQYNPAGLVQQRGLALTLDARVAWQDVRFTDVDGNTAHSDAPFFAPGDAVLAYGLGPTGPLGALSVALGVTTPTAVGRFSYPANGPQRYELIASDYKLWFYSAGVALRVLDSLSVGLTLQLAQGSATFSRAVRPVTGDDVSFDAVATITGRSSVAPTGVVGLTWQPHPDWTLGASYRPRFHFTANGALTSQLPGKALAFGATQTGQDAVLKLPFPDVVRVGVATSALPPVRLELDAVYEGWAVFDHIDVLATNVRLSSNLGAPQDLGDVQFPKHMQDAVSVRVGAEWDALPAWVTLRAGYIFETSATPDAFIAVDFPGWQRQVASLGLTLNLGGIALDVAYARHFLPAKDITTSQVAQTVTPSLVTGTPAPTPLIVGNGHYATSIDVFAFGVRIAYDGFVRP